MPKRSEEHTSELQSRPHLVCRLLLEKKKKTKLEADRQGLPWSWTVYQSRESEVATEDLALRSLLGVTPVENIATFIFFFFKDPFAPNIPPSPLAPPLHP